MKIWLLNVLLAASVALLGIKAYAIWSEGTRPMPSAEPSVEAAAFSEGGLQGRRVIEETAYDPVVEHNLFSPSRQAPEVDEEEEEIPVTQEISESPQAPTSVFLNGVILADDYQAALINNQKPAAGEKREKWVKIGDRIAGFQVVAIEKDKIVLEEEGEEYEISLFDKQKPGRKVAAAKQQKGPTVVAVSAGTEKTGAPPKTGGEDKKAAEKGPSRKKTEKKEQKSVFGPVRKQDEAEEKDGQQAAESEKQKNPFVEILKRLKEKKQNEPLPEGQSPLEGLFQGETD